MQKRTWLVSVLVAAFSGFVAVTPVTAQGGCGGEALNLGVACSGLSIGNSHRWTGIGGRLTV